MGKIRVFPNLLLSFLDGGNLNASSIDMEAEDEAVIEAEPAQPKRKLIATLQVIIGVTYSLSALALCPCLPHFPTVEVMLGAEPAVCAVAPSLLYFVAASKTLEPS